LAGRGARSCCHPFRTCSLWHIRNLTTRARADEKPELVRTTKSALIVSTLKQAGDNDGKGTTEK
jgi:hypothetical protein